jgi:hypothetical protein
VHIGLPGGITTEDIALHRGAEFDMPMDELKWVDVTEHSAENGNLIREAEHLSEEDAMDEIAVHIIVNLALEGTVAVEQQPELGSADDEIVLETNFPRPQLDGTVKGPEDNGLVQQTLKHLQRLSPSI